MLLASLLLGLIGGNPACGQTEPDAGQAQTALSVPPYIRRGNEVEARYRAYRDHPLAVQQRIIDAHIQYNRLWQPHIAQDQPGYDRQTVLHDAVLARQTILDALSATDEAAFLWIVHVPLYADIEDTEFVHAFQTAVENVWQVRDGEEEFRVQLSITAVSTTELYSPQTAPRQGEAINLQAHIARFPQGGGVLTTGAHSTHVLAGRCIALAPHDLAPHVLGHEFGHVLGFRDVYFRGYKDLGADGYQVMEVVADPDDIMGNPESGPVLRRHFARLIEKVSSAAPH